jgi:hypothetical protein
MSLSRFGFFDLNLSGFSSNSLLSLQVFFELLLFFAILFV